MNLATLAAVESFRGFKSRNPGARQVGRIQILVISRDQVARDRYLGCIGDQNAFEVAFVTVNPLTTTALGPGWSRPCNIDTIGQPRSVDERIVRALSN